MSCLVSPRRLRRCAPTRFAAFISAATRFLPTVMPCPRTSLACTLGEPAAFLESCRSSGLSRSAPCSPAPALMAAALPVIETRRRNLQEPAHHPHRVVRLLRVDEPEQVHRVVSFAKKTVAFTTIDRSCSSSSTRRRSLVNSSRSTDVNAPAGPSLSSRPTQPHRPGTFRCTSMDVPLGTLPSWPGGQSGVSVKVGELHPAATGKRLLMPVLSLLGCWPARLKTTHRVGMVVLDASLTSAPAKAAAHCCTTMLIAGSTCATSRSSLGPPTPGPPCATTAPTTIATSSPRRRRPAPDRVC